MFCSRQTPFCLASLSEGIANVVLEAMACGLPVVITDCGGMREAVAMGWKALSHLCATPMPWRWHWRSCGATRFAQAELGNRARQRVCAEFLIEGQINQFFELFQKLTECDVQRIFALANR